MPYEQALTYRFNPFDVTKVWPHKDFPLISVGRMVLNRNPDNYFGESAIPSLILSFPPSSIRFLSSHLSCLSAETEQAAFSPSHMVPGIEPSPDKMLQGRLFSYPDTHRHRLGSNYDQIPINCPYAARVLSSLRSLHALLIFVLSLCL